MHACDAGYVRSAPHASAYLRMRSGTRASSTANDSDAWGSRCADLPATAAGSGIPARKCSCCVEHCQMSARGGGMPPQSRAVTCIDSPDLAGHRLRAPDWPIHLDQLPASRGACGGCTSAAKRYWGFVAPAGLHVGRTPAHVWSAAHVCAMWCGLAPVPYSVRNLALSAFLRKQTIRNDLCHVGLGSTFFVLLLYRPDRRCRSPPPHVSQAHRLATTSNSSR